MTPETKEDILRKFEQEQRPEPRVHWHWQNLNDKKSIPSGYPWSPNGFPWEGRCWWHFRSKDRHPSPTVQFSWCFWRALCGIGFDIDDEDLTLQVSLPGIALWLSFSVWFKWVDRLAPKKVLNAVHYPNTIVIDERECSVKIHSGCLWIKLWGGDDWTRSDPWWKRGVSFSVNPFELVHMRHEVRCFNDGGRAWNSFYWEPYVGSWEHDKQPDHRDTYEFPYRYTLKSGEVQNRTATVYVERRAWRPKCLRWISLFEKVRTSIDVAFDQEIGERVGTWKGGTVGCGWELLPGEDVASALRRMEAVRKFE